MIERVTKAVLERMRKTLAQGKIIAIVGWRTSNHSQFTNELPSGKVVFTQNPELTQNVGYALLTRFVTHGAVAKIKRQAPFHAVPISIGEIKRLLEACSDLLTPVCDKLASIAVVGTPTPTPAASQLDTHEEILDYITQPAREQTLMEKFAKAFMAVAERTGSATVSAATLAKLRREYQISESAQHLMQSGWVISEIPEGKQKASQYRASEKLAALARSTVAEPTDPIERAKFLIGQKGSVLAEKAVLTAQMKALDGKLELISQAERLLKELSELMKR